jgi:hypothetical protein
VVAESKSNNGDNLNNARCEIGRTLRNKRRGYLKEKINALETNSKAIRMKISETYVEM